MQPNNFLNVGPVVPLKLDGVRIVSCGFCPVKPLSFLQEKTPVKVFSGTIVTPADADNGGAVCNTAVTFTVREPETVGAEYVAVYVPDAVIVPSAAFPPFTPFTCQMTGAFEFCTPAENCKVWLLGTLAVAGEILRVTGGATIVTFVLPNTDRSVWSVAVMVTILELGIDAGAV